MSESGHPPDRLLWALQERAKELNCLYEVEELLSRPETPLEEVLDGLVKALPPGWQYPEACEAAVELEGRVWPDGFRPTPWRQTAPIQVQERPVGRIVVQYTRELPGADEGPFLREEGRLIRTIADRVGHFLLHRRLKDVFREMQAAQAVPAGEARGEWRAALRLLRRTDQDLLLRVSRKMAYHLGWSGEREAQALLSGFGAGESNEPTPRGSPEPAPDLADRVFTLAAAQLPDAEILSRIQQWILEDRTAFLVKAVLNRQSTPSEIADALRRHRHMFGAGEGFSPAMSDSVRVALIRRFLSEEPEYLQVAKDYIGLPDVLDLLEHLIAPAGSAGRVGGKAAGLFLASRILKDEVRVPRAWYLASDGLQEFVRLNNLEEVYEQKYKPIERSRQEYPHIIQVFKHCQFPPETAKGLSVVLDDLHDGPLVVRSSSLLEDRLGAAFSGKYKSLFLANRGSKGERLAALLDAIAEVYASVFGPDPIQYRAERGLLHVREEMGILIQEVVGNRVGRWFLPTWAGVAVGLNEFRWSPRIRREDGLVRIVPGLGTRAVDRLRDDYPILLAPGAPDLRVNATPEEVVRYAPQKADVVDLESRGLTTVPVSALLGEGLAWPGADLVVSVLEGGRLRRKPSLLLDGARDRTVVTFDGLTEEGTFLPRVKRILDRLREVLGTPVDIEFASDGVSFDLLQCRPQQAGTGSAPSPIPTDISAERLLFNARRHVSNGRVRDASHVVFVDPDAYAGLKSSEDLHAVGRAVGRLNHVLPKRRFILMGPGRWGSRGDPRLGVQVTYSDICNAAALVEIGRSRGGSEPDLSFGTHFFQDMVEAGIRYLPLYPDDPGITFAWAFFRESRNELAALIPEDAGLETVVRVVDVPAVSGGRRLRILADADRGEAVGFLVDPEEEDSRADGGPVRPVVVETRADHSRWRASMAERIAAALPARFGVRAVYLIGSVKNGTAGPESDIDLLLHVPDDGPGSSELGAWLSGWSLCLDEMNFLRTGRRTGGLLDVHLVTDRDVAERTSFAVKIGAATDPARRL